MLDADQIAAFRERFPPQKAQPTRPADRPSQTKTNTEEETQ